MKSVCCGEVFKEWVQLWVSETLWILIWPVLSPKPWATLLSAWTSTNSTSITVSACIPCLKEIFYFIRGRAAF